MNTGDTQFFNTALAEYRTRTGDVRDVASLPSNLLSQILLTAQTLKEKTQ